jgi:hypothetical protein
MSFPVFLLSFVTIFFLLVEINRRMYRRRHLGNLGRETHYVSRTDNHIGARLRKTYLADRQPDPLPRTELVEPRNTPEPPHEKAP